MNKILAVLFLITGLITYVHATDVTVKVGGSAGENIFDPSTIVAMAGDNIIFTWVSGKHSIIESDAAKSCIKSVKTKSLSSGGVFEAPKTLNVPISSGKGDRNIWFYCGVPGHCEGGMYGTIEITDPNIPAALPPSNGTMPGMSPNNTNNTNNTNDTNDTNPIMVGAILGALAFGSLFTVGGFLLYRKFKNRKKKVILIADDNRNKEILLIADDNRNNYNPRQIPNNSSSGQILNNSNPRQIPNNSNPGQIPDNRNDNQIHNGTRNNHEQEAIPISENDNLRSYIVQVIRQEMTQNQSK